MEAAAVIVSPARRRPSARIVKLVRALRPDIRVVSRARDAAHARHLYAIGVTDAVPETIEASLAETVALPSTPGDLLLGSNGLDGPITAIGNPRWVQGASAPGKLTA
jgi:hypothetical protein